MNRPHTIDRGWREDFVIALRMRDVEAAEVANQLKLVEVHCAESGETVQEAFGDPRAYAAAVTGRADDAGVIDLLPTAALSIVGGSLLVRGGVALVQGERVSLTVGAVLAAVVLVGASLILVRVATAVRRPVLPLLGVTVAAVVVAVLADVAQTPRIASFPPWAALLASLAVFGAVAVRSRREARRQQVTDPVTGATMV